MKRQKANKLIFLFIIGCLYVFLVSDRHFIDKLERKVAHSMILFAMIGNFSRNERLNFNYIFILSSVKKGTIILILTYSEITNGNITSIVINTPTVLLYFVNTVSIATYVINIHYRYTIVCIDGHMIDVVCWTSEVVAINTIYETTTRRTL